MAIRTPDHAQPDLRPRPDPTRVESPKDRASKWATEELYNNPDNMALHPHRRRGLSGIKKIAAAGALAVALTGVNAAVTPFLNNSDRQSASETHQGQYVPEAKPLDFIAVSDLPLKSIPTKNFDGNIAININKEQNFPALLLSKGIADSLPDTTPAFWETVKTINNTDITQAINSNGKIEIILQSPLAEPKEEGGFLIFVLTDGNEPLIIDSTDGPSKGIYVGEPHSKGAFKDVLPDANAFDFGKVDLLETPKMIPIK